MDNIQKVQKEIVRPILKLSNECYNKFESIGIQLIHIPFENTQKVGLFHSGHVNDA